jgi:hypothetical protein
MAEGEARKAISSEAFANCVVDHHSLVNREDAVPDVFIHVDEKNVQTAHYYVLKMRLPQILEEGPALDKKKTEKGGKKKDTKVVIKLKKTELITQNALERVLIWAYSGIIDYHDSTPFKAIEVMRACTVYKLPRLQQMNEVYLQQNLSMSNIFSLLKFADSLNVQEAKDICFEFALANSDFFTSSSAENLGFKLYQEVTALLLKAHQGTAPKARQREVTADDSIIADFKNLFSSADVTGDVTFIIHNEEVKAHRAILWHQSPDIAGLLNPPEDSKEPPKKGLVLDSKYGRITPGAFNAMLRYFYYSDTSIGMLHATELVDFVKDYHLDKLYRVLEKVIGGQDMTIETVLNVLDVAYNPLLEENPALQKNLQEEGLNFAVNNVDKINFEPLQSLPPIIATHILQALQRRIGKNWGLISEAAGTKPLKIEEIKSSTGGGGAWTPRKPEVKKDSSSGGDAFVKSGSKTNVTSASGSSANLASDKKSSKRDEKKGSEREGSKDEARAPARSKSSSSKKHEDDKVSTPKK